MKHTPTPWEVHIPRKDIRTMFGGDTGIEILQPLTNPETGQCGGYQIVIGHVNCQSKVRILTKEDAEFICRAVNSHDELLEALENLLNEITAYHGTLTYKTKAEQTFASAFRSRASAYAAIAKAKGES